MIAIQFAGASSIAVWAGATGLVLFWTLYRAGLMRASKDADLFGLDIAEHKTRAYPEDVENEFP